MPGNKDAYYPQKDHIRIPKVQDFVSLASYYATLFHEMIHATGHNTRLNREGIANANSSDEIQSAREELVADMGASYTALPKKTLRVFAQEQENSMQ